jgi:hypothetical protein
MVKDLAGLRITYGIRICWSAQWKMLHQPGNVYTRVWFGSWPMTWQTTRIVCCCSRNWRLDKAETLVSYTLVNSPTYCDFWTPGMADPSHKPWNDSPSSEDLAKSWSPGCLPEAATAVCGSPVELSTTTSQRETSIDLGSCFNMKFVGKIRWRILVYCRAQMRGAAVVKTTAPMWLTVTSALSPWSERLSR